MYLKIGGLQKPGMGAGAGSTPGPDLGPDWARLLQLPIKIDITSFEKFFEIGKTAKGVKIPIS